MKLPGQSYHLKKGEISPLLSVANLAKPSEWMMVLID
jgi:hypothetical protein